MTEDHPDCVVVGSGAGGGTLAQALARKGLDVLVVERGGFVKPPDGHERNPERIGYAEWECGPGADAGCVGGSTKFYGAALYRLREADFHAQQLESGPSVEWPIRYADLEPYYCQAEHLYSVHGSDEGDPSAPSRSTPYPYPPIPHQGIVRDMVERIAATGLPVCSIPRALDFREHGKCVLCPTCDAYYCRLDAKMDAETAGLVPAIASGQVRIAVNTECRKVLVSDDGRRATGVLLHGPEGERIVPADFVAVCAGIAGTPALLRRSRTALHPEGLGNDTGCLGRFRCGHTAAVMLIVTGLKPLVPVHTKTFAVNAFYGPSADWPYPRGVIQMAGLLPVRYEALPPGVRQAARTLVRRSMIAFCMTEEPSTYDSGWSFDGDDLVPLPPPPRSKKTLRWLCGEARRVFRLAGFPVVIRNPSLHPGWHSVGTARMGADPKTSVIDADCRVHGFENLYVVDSSSMPSPGAVNTALTIMALALRAADHVDGSRGSRLVPSQASAHRPLQALS